MSHAAEYEWRQRQEDQRRQYLNRVRSVTAEFATRYESVLDDVRRQGLHTAVPAEFAALSRQVADLRQLLTTDPERARDLSLALGQDIHALPRLARQAWQHARAQAEQRRRELGAELNSLLERTFLAIEDPVVRDFAYTAAAGIEAHIRTRVAQGDQLDAFRTQLHARMAEILAQAAAQAEAWKQTQRLKERDGVRAAVLADVSTVALAGDVAAQSGAREQAQAAIERAADEDGSSFDRAIATALESANQAVVDEESRRAAVRAVYASLQQAGFVVDQPYLEDGEGGNVILSARKPSGGQAQFRIGVEGDLIYKFDHYEGSACKQDLNQVLPMLEQVYGITLSNERVLWDNPDRFSKDARPLDDQEAQR